MTPHSILASPATRHLNPHLVGDPLMNDYSVTIHPGSTR